MSRLQGEIARLQQNAGELEVKQEEVKANYKRQVLNELQETSQRLLDINATLGTARQIRNLKVQKAAFGDDEPNYTIIITRTEQSGTVTFNATADTKIEPGDVIEVKFIRRDPIDPPVTEAALNPQKACRMAPRLLAIADALAGVKNKSADGDAGMPAQDLLVSGLQ